MLLIKGFDFLIDFYKLLSLIYEIEDLTRVVMKFIKRAFEMTTSVRFCLSYVPLKWDFFAFKMIIISIRNALLSMTLCLRAKVLFYTCGHTIFMI